MRVAIVTAILVSVALSAGVASDKDAFLRYYGWDASPVFREGCRGLEVRECVAAGESALIAMNPQVHRAGPVLSITLPGETKSFRNGEMGNCLYLGMIDRTPYHLLVFSYEESTYLLIHSVTGRTITIDSYPVVTPDSSRLATATPDFNLRGDWPNRVQIFLVGGDSLRLEYTLDALSEPYPRGAVFQWGPLHPRWVNKDTLQVGLFLRRSSWADSVEFERTPLLITNNMGHWVVQ